MESSPEAAHRGTEPAPDVLEILQAVGRVTAWREQELARILSQLPLAERTILTHALGQFVKAAGEGYGASLP